MGFISSQLDNSRPVYSKFKIPLYFDGVESLLWPRQIHVIAGLTLQGDSVEQVTLQRFILLSRWSKA
jgi:hypothetical protein